MCGYIGESAKSKGKKLKLKASCCWFCVRKPAKANGNFDGEMTVLPLNYHIVSLNYHKVTIRKRGQNRVLGVAKFFSFSFARRQTKSFSGFLEMSTRF